LCPPPSLPHALDLDSERDDPRRSHRVRVCRRILQYLADNCSFLAIFADVATIAIAYDRAPYARQPVEWQLPKVWIISTIMGEWESISDMLVMCGEQRD
jgi:hypothetical protein